MAEETDKGRPVQITSPGYLLDRTNHIRIQKDSAQRLIARYLRDTMNPAQANELANRIIDGMVSATPSPMRPGLRGWRMIDEHPPHGYTDKIASEFRAVRLQEDNYFTAAGAWKVVYKYGTGRHGGMMPGVRASPDIRPPASGTFPDHSLLHAHISKTDSKAGT